MRLDLAFASILFLALPSPVSGKTVVAGATFDQQHQLLSQLAGRWNVRQSFWVAPEKPPKIDVGTATFEMVLNERHLRQSLRINDGTGFEALSYVGYDNAAKHFFSTWMDVNFPGVIVAYGDSDGNPKTITLHGSMAQANGVVPVREVLTLSDANHLKYEFFETHHGTEELGVRLEYTRTP